MGESGPQIRYRTRYARNDWWMFALYGVAAAVISGTMGYGMRRDEIIAARVRAEHVARTLVVEFSSEAATPGSDFAATLPSLAAAMGGQAMLEVIQSSSDGSGQRYIGHSDANRVDTALNARLPADKHALELLSLARHETAHAAILWRDGLVNAAATAPSGDTAIVDGFRPTAPSHRPALFALGTFLFLLVFGAGFHDVLYRAGQVLNLGVLAGVTFVAVRLATALEPSLWRGVASDPVVLRAETLKLVDIARAMAKDLTPPPSALTEWGDRVAWGAVGFYFIALFGLWHRLGRAVGRDERAYRYVGPAFATFLVCAGGPVLMGIGLAFWRVTPTARSYLGFSNFAALASPAPTTLWRTLVSSVAWVAASALLQVVCGCLLAVIVARSRGRWRGVYRALLFLPWAVPGYIGALLWAHLWQQSIEPISAVLGLAGSGWATHPAAAFGVNLAASVWMGAPLIMAVGVVLLDRITPDEWDAARMEGVIGLGAVRFVVVPVLRPMLLPAAAFSLFSSLNAFAVVDLITGGGPDGATDLLVTRAYHWAFARIEYGYAAAWSVVALILSVLLALVILRAMRRRASLPLAPTALAFEGR